MHLTNHTPYAAAYNPGLLPEGRHCLVIALKATYRIVPDAEPLPLAEQQQPLNDTDAYQGEPGDSSLQHDHDLAPYKPRCDVLIDQPTAHVPKGRRARQIEVALQINQWRKAFRVLGPRTWQRGLLTTAGEPDYFSTQPLTWEIAYGGTDPTAYPKTGQSEAYPFNPVGTGYWRKPKRKQLHDSPIAQTEALEQPINDPGARYMPQGYGPVARNWQTRSQYVGTYDEHWMDHIRPFLPADFDPRYHQSAAPDQQIPYPNGGETVTLTHLTPDGHLQFHLPTLREVIHLTPVRGPRITLQPVVDTLTIDPQAATLTLVARAHHPLRHSLHDITACTIGTPPPKPVVVPFADLLATTPSARSTP